MKQMIMSNTWATLVLSPMKELRKDKRRSDNSRHVDRAWDIHVAVLFMFGSQSSVRGCRLLSFFFFMYY